MNEWQRVNAHHLIGDNWTICWIYFQKIEIRRQKCIHHLFSKFVELKTKTKTNKKQTKKSVKSGGSRSYCSYNFCWWRLWRWWKVIRLLSSETETRTRHGVGISLSVTPLIKMEIFARKIGAVGHGPSEDPCDGGQNSSIFVFNNNSK